MKYNPLNCLRAPLALTEEILAKLHLVSPDEEPIEVPITPTPQCMPRDCLENVRRLLHTRGGELVPGWSVCVWPRIWLELERHCVWRHPDDDSMHDTTPREFGDTTCLFLPDYERGVSYRPTQTLKIALTDDPHVLNLIEFCKRNDRLWRTFEFQTMYLQLMERIEWKPEAEDPCICGKRVTYGDCCGRN